MFLDQSFAFFVRMFWKKINTSYYGRRGSMVNVRNKGGILSRSVGLVVHVGKIGVQ